MTKQTTPKKKRQTKQKVTKEFSILNPSESILEEKPLSFEEDKMEKVEVTFEELDIVKRIDELEKVEHKLVEIKEEIKFVEHPELSNKETTGLDSSVILLWILTCTISYALGFASFTLFNAFF